MISSPINTGKYSRWLCSVIYCFCCRRSFFETSSFYLNVDFKLIFLIKLICESCCFSYCLIRRCSSELCISLIPGSGFFMCFIRRYLISGRYTLWTCSVIYCFCCRRSFFERASFYCVFDIKLILFIKLICESCCFSYCLIRRSSSKLCISLIPGSGFFMCFIRRYLIFGRYTRWLCSVIYCFCCGRSSFDTSAFYCIFDIKLIFLIKLICESCCLSYCLIRRCSSELCISLIPGSGSFMCFIRGYLISGRYTLRTYSVIYCFCCRRSFFEASAFYCIFDIKLIFLIKLICESCCLSYCLIRRCSGELCISLIPGSGFFMCFIRGYLISGRYTLRTYSVIYFFCCRRSSSKVPPSTSYLTSNLSFSSNLYVKVVASVIVSSAGVPVSFVSPLYQAPVPLCVSSGVILSSAGTLFGLCSVIYCFCCRRSFFEASAFYCVFDIKLILFIKLICESCCFSYCLIRRRSCELCISLIPGSGFFMCFIRLSYLQPVHSSDLLRHILFLLLAFPLRMFHLLLHT